MDRTQITRRSDPRTAITCGLLLLIFAVISYSAVLTKNATIDEPTHAMSGWTALRRSDFRVETVNPPLWKCWAALGNLFSNPPLTHDSAIWQDRTWDPQAEVIWSGRTLFQSPGFDGDGFINRARFMMLLLGIALGVVIAFWSYRLSGRVAGVASVFIFSFDPNFIAHAPLIKSDVAFSLVFLGLSYALHRLGEKVTIKSSLFTALFCGLCVNVKFSGVIAGPVLATVLLIRALLPGSWSFFGRELLSIWQRVIAASSIAIFCALCSFLMIWACYGFRYRPAPSPAVQMDMPAIYAKAKLVDLTVQLRHKPTLAELHANGPAYFSNLIDWATQRHLLPQAMLAGLLYQHTCVQLWPAFLNGERYNGIGHWEYFPLAMLYKTPVSEWIAIALGLFTLCFSIRKISSVLWPVVCLLIPFLFFATAALQTHLNIGVRNVLPLYPFLIIATGVAIAQLWKQLPRATLVLMTVLAIGLACETLSYWPDYIAFFNLPTGGENGGKFHLADSNLDWGQDLKTLAQWQKQQPSFPLFTQLFDSVDPAFYGINSHEITIPQTGPHAGEPASDIPFNRGWIAVSVTHLQGLYIKPWEEDFYNRLRNTRPVAILGGTIYIYALPLR